MNNCDLCGKKTFTEFIVKSKHLAWVLSDMAKYHKNNNSYITRHICKDCFKKIFGKPEDKWEEVKKQCDEAKKHLIPYTVEQNCGENRVEGGVLSVSGSVSEKHFKPFNNCDELIEVFREKCEAEVNCSTYFPTLYKACVWVKHKHYGTENLITAFDNDNESIGGSCVFIQDMWCDMAELFEQYTFLDGSPVGKLEE